MTAVVTCYRSVFDTAGGVVRPWSSLRERARSPRVYRAKADVPRYCDGPFSHRSLSGFGGTDSLTVDFDVEPFPTRADVVEAFGSLSGFGYSTWSHTPDRPVYRVNVALRRHVATLGDRDRVWRALAVHAEKHGLAPHYGSRDACHPWALPARHDGDTYDFIGFDGQPFDVDGALKLIPEPTPPEPVAYAPTTETARRVERASKWLACCEPSLQGSGGSAALMHAVVGLVRGFALDEDDALTMIVCEFNARCKPFWRDREILHALKSARRSPKALGYLLDAPRRCA